MNIVYILILFLSASFITSCSPHDRNVDKTIKMSDIADWQIDSYRLSPKEISLQIERLRKVGLKMYADEYVRQYYGKDKPFLWVYRGGVEERADTLLKYLETATRNGLPENVFKTKRIKSLIQQIRTLDFQTNEINRVYAETEYLLTTAYLRFVCGELYGYTRPDLLFNRLEKEDAKATTPYTRLFDIKIESADSIYAQQAIKAIEKKTFAKYLLSVKPKHHLFEELSGMFRDTADTMYRQKVIANLERLRWRTTDLGEKYVMVNLAAMQLQAINNKDGDSLEMRVCGGTLKHKSPMLNSQIERIDLNPYWNIPFSIIKKEIAPLHAQDSAYFARNCYRIFEKKSGEEMDPKEVTRKMLLSNNYKIRQDNGEGNSLGRLILRFPNNFAVYLHDTNNKSAFNRKQRTVSHGCIRLERPLDLAIFVLDQPEEEKIDKIRTAIGLPPLNEEHQEDMSDTTDVKMEILHVKPSVPVLITYYTLFPDINGKWTEHPDLYGYDKVILQKLSSY